MQTTITDVKFNQKFKSELRIELSCTNKPRNRNNLPNNEGKFRKMEEKRLPQFSNPPIPFLKVFRSKVHVISDCPTFLRYLGQFCQQYSIEREILHGKKTRRKTVKN